jgi:hypothetical protein
MSSSDAQQEAAANTLPPPTAGPLEVGYYVLTESFRSIPEHMAVMRPDGGLIALVGASTDPQSLADALMFRATPALFNACLLALSLVKGVSPAVDQAVEEALALASVKVVPGSRGRFVYVPEGETISSSAAKDTRSFEHVASFSEDAGGEVTHVVRRRLSDGKLFEYLDWVGYDTASEVLEVINETSGAGSSSDAATN